jgi:MFS family permease
LDQVEAGNAVMYVYLAAVVFTLPLGIIVDKYGHRIYFFIGTMVMYLATYLLFLGLPDCRSGPMMEGLVGNLMLGLSYAMYSNYIVPLLPYLVKRNIMGTALGLLATL